MYPPSGHVDVDEFVSSWEQIWRNIGITTLAPNGSSALKTVKQPSFI